MKELGEKIKKMRKIKGWNFNQLAAKAEISNRMVSMIENGQNCSVEILVKLAKALDMPPSYFLS